LTLFDEWKRWAEHNTLRKPLADCRRYYCSWEFDRHFIEFLSSRPNEERSDYEEVLLEFEQELMRALGSKGEPAMALRKVPETALPKIARSDMRVALEEGVFLLDLQGDVKRAVDMLQKGVRSDGSIRRPTKVMVHAIADTDEVDIVEMTPAVAEFLAFCKADACVDEVLTRFAATFGDFEGIKAWDIAVHGLRTLYKRKLIRLLPGELCSAENITEPHAAVQML
jgi:hypothetical protein